MMKKFKTFKTIDNKDVALGQLMTAEYQYTFSQLGLPVEGKLYKLSLSEYVRYSECLEKFFANFNASYAQAANDVKRNRELILQFVPVSKTVQSGLIKIHCE